MEPGSNGRDVVSHPVELVCASVTPNFSRDRPSATYTGYTYYACSY